VVKGTIPDNSIAVGAPARVVKQYNFEHQCWERV
jgi:acetyltransferase-like isoleucine patch superfamily enzyme